jgi:CHAD domain-containing protein
MVTAAPGMPAAPPSRCGAYAAELIRRQTRRLGKLQPEVLADADPEPLHQLRVSLRRLRTALSQFAPALELPDGIGDRRIARVARRTGLCRDLDVLQQRLEQDLLPPLPEKEREALQPLLKHLRRDRRQAFAALEEALRGAGYLKLLARLHAWQSQPCFTPLGEEPLDLWLFEWQSQVGAGLFLHPGWCKADPTDPALHDLRKRIKGVRYALEHLEPFGTPALGAMVAELKQAQDNLGDLHDLQVLDAALAGGRSERSVEAALPALRGLIAARQQACWRGWCDLRASLRSPASRQRFHTALFQAAA